MPEDVDAMPDELDEPPPPAPLELEEDAPDEEAEALAFAEPELSGAKSAFSPSASSPQACKAKSDEPK